MKRALVVVDMIEDFAHDGGALYCGPSMARIVPVIQREIERSRAAGEPVVHLTDSHLPDDAEFEMFPPHAIVGTNGARIVAELAPAAGDVVIPKRRVFGLLRDRPRHHAAREGRRHFAAGGRLHQHLRPLHRG